MLIKRGWIKWIFCNLDDSTLLLITQLNLKFFPIRFDLDKYFGCLFVCINDIHWSVNQFWLTDQFPFRFEWKSICIFPKKLKIQNSDHINIIGIFQFDYATIDRTPHTHKHTLDRFDRSKIFTWFNCFILNFFNKKILNI